MDDAAISFTTVTPVFHAGNENLALLSRSASLCPFIRRVENGGIPAFLTSLQSNIVGYRIALRNPWNFLASLVLEVEQTEIEDGVKSVVEANRGDNLTLQCWAGCPGEDSRVQRTDDG